MIPKIPTNTRELGEGFESFKKDVTVSTEKAVTTVGKDVTGQISPTEFVASLYAPSAKKPETGSGETVSVGEQLTPKPGELFGNIAGAPLEPGQEQQTESALGQISIPVDKFTNTLMGSPMEPGENAPTEDPLEQLLPTSNQVGAWATGSASTQRVTPHMETAGQQIIPSIDEVSGILGIPASEGGHSASRQPQASAMEQNASVAGSGGSSAGAENMQGSDTMQNPASQPPEVQQMMQQKQQQAELNQAGVDPAMQMSSDERAKYSEEQKAKREQMMLHQREYAKFGTPLDPIGSLEEQVSKIRQQKKQEEEQMKQQEEEEEEKRKKEEEEQKRQELPEPGTKDKPGNPNIAIGQSQKKTEVHRGSAG
jgi:hypothetical protein